MSAGSFDFAAHMETVARALLGQPRDILEGGAQWRYGSKGSLAVNVGGPNRGTWADYEAGDGGGVLDLIRRERGCANGAAIDWMRDELGIDIPRRGRGRPSTADYARELAIRMKPLAGTAAEKYLIEARGLAGPFPADLGFHPRVRAKAGGEHPALVCLARDGGGEVAFVHAVFVDADGRKAAFEPAKQTFGKMDGAAVRIPAANSEAGARIVLAEGPEDALSWAQATGLEAWACCGLASLGKAAVPKGTEVIVAAQNDPADKEAAKVLHKAVRRLRGRGFRVIVAPPPEGTKDANDLLRAAGADGVRTALAEAEERAGWRADLIYGGNGAPAPVLYNAILALSQDDQWHGVFAYDQFADTVVMRRPAPWLIDRGVFAEREWTDLDDIRTAEWLQQRGILVSHDLAGRAAQRVASDWPFHPVREWLDGLKWDGVTRLDTWLTDYLGAAPTAYTCAVGSKWAIAAVARIFKPGCKVDTCLILEGPQGLRKSTGLRALVGDAWFSDQMPDLGTKDSMVQVRGKWVIELAELDSLSRGEVSCVKAFMSTQVDRFRPPYGKRAADHPRQCVFAGTVNLDDYLRDETGGRRFWPVRCGARIDLDGLARDRAQLWAEAVHRFKAGEAWWLDTMELSQAAAEEQADRYQGDPWEEYVAEAIKDKRSIAISTLLTGWLGVGKDKLDQRAQNRVARILRSMGWQRRRDSEPDPATGKRGWAYYPPDPSEPSQYGAACPTTGTATGTAENSEKSTRRPSCPTCPTYAPKPLGGNPEKSPGAAGADFSGKVPGVYKHQVGQPGQVGRSFENKGKTAVPLSAGHTGTASYWDSSDDAPEDFGDDADAEERAAIEAIDGEAEMAEVEL